MTKPQWPWKWAVHNQVETLQNLKKVEIFFFPQSFLWVLKYFVAKAPKLGGTRSLLLCNLSGEPGFLLSWSPSKLCLLVVLPPSPCSAFHWLGWWQTLWPGHHPPPRSCAPVICFSKGQGPNHITKSLLFFPFLFFFATICPRSRFVTFTFCSVSYREMNSFGLCPEVKLKTSVDSFKSVMCISLTVESNCVVGRPEDLTLCRQSCVCQSRCN